MQERFVEGFALFSLEKQMFEKLKLPANILNSTFIDC